MKNFLVPVIGVISSGKSSFLNALLGTEIFQIDSDITTQFFCIIRHNESLSNPILYKIKEQENLNAPGLVGQVAEYEKDTKNEEEDDDENANLITNAENKELPKDSKKEDELNIFEKGEKVAEGIKNIKTKIEEINQKISEEKEYEELTNQDLFYILELNIHIFKEFQINPKYAKTFDFVDVPGLNDGDDKRNDFFIQKIKTYNDSIGFFIFVIDAEYSAKKDGENVLSKFRVEKETKNNMIVITKKDTLVQGNDSDVISYMYDFNKDQIISICNDSLKVQSAFIQDKNILNCAQILFTDFTNQKKMKLIDQDMLFSTFCDEQYQMIEREIQKKENIQIPINKEFDDFLKTNDAEDAKETLINLMSHYQLKLVNKICITLRDVIGNLKSCYESNGKRYYAFDYLPEKCKNLIEELERLWKNVSKKENNAIHIIKEDINSLIDEYKYNQRIRIPLIGGYNVGKSSILNSIIGKNILPVSCEECTKKAIIVRYSHQLASELYRLKDINENVISEENAELIISGDYNSIRRKIEELNKDNNFSKDSFFYLLKTNIRFFEEYDIPEKMRDLIEFIDFPGLDVKNEIYINYFLPMIIQSSKTFLFINNRDLIKDKGNQEIFAELIESIKGIRGICNKASFYKCCIIVLNKMDNNQTMDKNKIINSILSCMDKNIAIEEIQAFKDNSEIVSFSSQKYGEEIDELLTWTNLEDTFYRLQHKYQINKIWEKKKITFSNYCKEELQKRINNLPQLEEQKRNYDNCEPLEVQKVTFNQLINNFKQESTEQYEFSEQEQNDCLKYHNYLKKHYHIKNEKNITDFFDRLKTNVEKAYEEVTNYRDTIIKEITNEVNNKLDRIYEKIEKPPKNNEDVIKQLKDQIDELLNSKTEKQKKYEETFKKIEDELNKDIRNNEMDNAHIQNLKQKYKCIEGNLPSVIKKAYIERIKEVLKELKIQESVKIQKHLNFFQKLGISLTGGIITGGIGGGVMTLIDVSSVTIIGGLTGGISFAIGAVGVGIYTLYSVLSNNKIKEHFSNVKKELLDCIDNTKKKFEELIIKNGNKQINDLKTELSLESGEFSKLQKEKVEVLKNEANNLFDIIKYFIC